MHRPLVALPLIALVVVSTPTGCDEPGNRDEDRADTICPLAYKPISWSSDIIYIIHDACPGICTMEIRTPSIATFEPSGDSMRLRIRGCINFPCDITTAPDFESSTAELFLCDRHADPEQNTEDVVLKSRDNQTVLYGFTGQPPWSFIVTEASPKPHTFRAAQDPLE